MEKRHSVMVVSPGPALRWVMEEMKRRYGWGIHYASDPYEAGMFLENTSVDAVVCEAAPTYSSESRLIREISQRSLHLPVILFVEPEGEDYALEQIGHGSFHVVRPETPLEELHQVIEHAIERAHRAKAA